MTSDFVPAKSIMCNIELGDVTPTSVAEAFPDVPESCEIIDVMATLPADTSCLESRRQPMLRFVKMIERLVLLSGEEGQEKLAALLDEYAISVFRGGELLYQSREYVDQIMRAATGGKCGSLVGAHRAET